MIRTKLTPILTASGCTHIMYEAKQLTNIIADESLQAEIIGLILEPDNITLEVKANAIMEHFPPVVVEVLKQVRLEDKATNNEVLMDDLLIVCKKIVLNIIGASQNKAPFAGLDICFKKIVPISVTKVLETKYDANMIGWSMPLDLTYLHNENKDPCL